MPSSLLLFHSYQQQQHQQNLAPIPENNGKRDESEEEKRHKKKKQKKDENHEEEEEAKKKSRRRTGEESRFPVTPSKGEEENATTSRQQQKRKKREEGGATKTAAAEKATTANTNALLLAAAFSSPPPAATPPPPPLSTSSSYRGVSCHRSTRRWEASIWLGRRQAYLGGFEVEEDAARAYDLASLACRGKRARQPGATNFSPEEYAEELNALAQAAGMKEKFDLSSRSSPSFPVLPIDLVVAHVRRRSTAFARGRSPFRGVSGEEGRWEARIGGLFGRKNVRSYFFNF